MVKEQGSRGTRRETAFLKHLLQQVGRLGAQGTSPFLCVLAAQHDAGRWGQLQVDALQTRNPANARTGVEHEAQQGQSRRPEPVERSIAPSTVWISSKDRCRISRVALRLKGTLKIRWTWAKCSGALSIHIAEEAVDGA
jgi:hypothetical protein